MKSIKLAILSFLVVVLATAGTAYADPSTPRFVVGYCENASDDTLADGSQVIAYLERDVGNKIYDLVGPDGENSDTSKYFSLDANALSAVTGDVVIIEVSKIVEDNTYFDITRVMIIGDSPYIAPNMQLKQIDSHVALILGQITDINTGIGVPGASLVVDCLANTETTSATADSQGNYYAVLSCPVGATVEVTATSGTESGSETGVVAQVGSIGTEIDVGLAHITVGIPEFPVAILPALLSMFSMGIVRRFKK